MARRHKRLSLLWNPTRRRIYELVCESPGIHYNRLTSELKISQGTLSWHLQQLKNEDLISTTKFGGKRIVYPRILSCVKSAQAFAALGCETAQQIFMQVRHKPGINQQKIADAVGVGHETVRYHLNRFEQIGLVERYRDGRDVRGFLGELGESLASGQLKSSKEQFVPFLVQKLEEGCLTPITVSQHENHVSLCVSGPGDAQFEIIIDFTEFTFLTN